MKKFAETIIPVITDKDDLTQIPVRTGNERIQAGLLSPEMFSILGSIWQSGELAILFGGTGSGKSILAVQIADKISRGESLNDEFLRNECGPQIILFFDFELSDKQFQVRYTPTGESKNAYQFSENLKFINISFGEIYDPKKNLSETVFTLIISKIKETKASVLIIDNITALSNQDNQDGNAAMEIMAFLDRLKREHSLSILVIAHTPKKYNYAPITISDLAGSAKIPNFADSVFAMGKSIKSSDYRYLIQVKFSRSKGEEFDANNVLTLFKLKDYNFLKFEITGTTIEKEHISDEGEDLRLTAISLKKQGMSVRAIEEKLKVSKSTVSNWTKNSK